MNTQRKRLEKERRRARAVRVERQRRLDSDRCHSLMLEAEIASESGDVEQCEAALQKVLRIRPHFAEALEWAAQICFHGDRSKEGLMYYQRLRAAPQWPPLTFLAALAAWKLGQAGQCQELLKEFLSNAHNRKEFASTWKAARLLAKDAERAASFSRSMAETMEETEGPVLPGSTPALSSKSAFAIEEESAATAAGIVMPEASPELPSFPPFAPPGIDIRFDFDLEPMPPQQTTMMAPAAEVFLRRDYAILKLQKGFDELLSLAVVSNFERFWYQLETARRVLRDFRGRALMADEVGLGKTIEACLALKEYTMRGLARKVLILTPPSLVAQWLDELRSKFDMAPVSPETGGYARDPEKFWHSHDLIVASLALARQSSNTERLAKIEYDLVIVDEAHCLKNRSTSAWQLVNGLKKRFLLLLSATPVGNNLSELYNLILLLRPGLLGTEAQFRREYGTARNTAGTNALKDPVRRDRLRGLLREVMIRNTRAHIDLKLPRRMAATEKVQPGAAEAEVLEELAKFIRSRYALGTPAERMRLMTLQMQAGSSPSALRYGLREHAASGGAGPLHAIAGKLDHLQGSAKADALIALARRSREKKIVFTRYRATLEELRSMLESQGWSVSTFHGSLTAAEKEAVIAEFRDRSEILLSTESGGEGRNLQFCNTVINYDLPWNPVTIEQRVGRVHRIGQTREVYVFNFCLTGSVEEYILKILHEKINLFELVAGEIEMILGELGQEQDFSSIVMDLWAGSAEAGGRESAFDRFTDELRRAKSQYQQTRELDQAVFGEDYEA